MHILLELKKINFLIYLGSNFFEKLHTQINVG